MVCKPVVLINNHFSRGALTVDGFDATSKAAPIARQVPLPRLNAQPIRHFLIEAPLRIAADHKKLMVV